MFKSTQAEKGSIDKETIELLDVSSDDEEGEEKLDVLLGRMKNKPELIEANNAYDMCFLTVRHFRKYAVPGMNEATAMKDLDFFNEYYMLSTKKAKRPKVFEEVCKRLLSFGSVMERVFLLQRGNASNQVKPFYMYGSENLDRLIRRIYGTYPLTTYDKQRLLNMNFNMFTATNFCNIKGGEQFFQLLTEIRQEVLNMEEEAHLIVPPVKQEIIGWWRGHNTNNKQKSVLYLEDKSFAYALYLAVGCLPISRPEMCCLDALFEYAMKLPDDNEDRKEFFLQIPLWMSLVFGYILDTPVSNLYKLAIITSIDIFSYASFSDGS